MTRHYPIGFSRFSFGFASKGCHLMAPYACPPRLRVHFVQFVGKAVKLCALSIFAKFNHRFPVYLTINLWDGNAHCETGFILQFVAISVHL